MHDGLTDTRTREGWDAAGGAVTCPARAVEVCHARRASQRMQVRNLRKSAKFVQELATQLHRQDAVLPVVAKSWC